MDNKKRRLKARNSCEKDLEVLDWPCVRGKWLKDLRVLPIEDMGAIGKFLPISAKDNWMHEILSGSKSSPSCRSALGACLSDLRAELLTKQGDGAGEITEKSVAESIREKIQASGLSDDESEDSFAENRRGTSSARSSARSRSRTSSAKLGCATTRTQDHPSARTCSLRASPETVQPPNRCTSARAEHV